MRTNILILGALFTIFIVCLSGCNNEEKNDDGKLSGEWIGEDGLIYVFSSNGSYSANGYRVGTWELNEGNLSITYGDGQITFDFDYSFSDNDNKLTLVSSVGDIAIYTKQ